MDSAADNRVAVVPTSRDPAGYAAVRSLSRQGITALVASDSPDDPARASRYCDEALLVPDPAADLLAYKDGLRDVAARPAVETVLPVRQHDAYVLSRYRSEFEPHVSLFVPSFDKLRSVHDRLALAEAAERAGVPTPRTRPLSAVDTIDEGVIIKSRYNVLADAYLPSYSLADCTIVKDTHHLRPGDDVDRAALREQMEHEPIVQEYIRASDEYMVGALYDHGDPLATFQHRQIRGNSYTGGGGVFRKSVAIPELSEVSHALLSELDWHGFACIEYLQDEETGEFYFAEINPRLWQSLPSAVRVGADFPYYYWLAATGRAEDIDCEYDIGVGTHSFTGELNHLYSLLSESSPFIDRPSVPRVVWDIARSCLRMPYFDYFHPDDPRPFLRNLANMLT